MPPGSRLLVIGARGHGRVVADLARTLGATVVGYADADPALRDGPLDAAGARLLLTQDEALAAARAGDLAAHGIDAIALGVGGNDARARLLGALVGVELPVLVHPTAWVSGTATLGRGTVVLAHAVINTDARLGAAVIVNSGAIVEHDCVLADAVHVSPGAVLAGGVTVGARSWIGAAAAVIQGLTVGDDTIVGAGAVVIRDLPAGVTAVGNPSRVLRG